MHNVLLINIFRCLISDDRKYEGLNDKGLYDFTEDAYKLLKAVQVLNGTFGMGMYILFLRGSNSSKLKPNQQKLPNYGSGKDKSETWWKGLGKHLSDMHDR